MRMQRGIKVMSGVIDALNVRKSYWTSFLLHEEQAWN